jgi:hypothetical protein
MQISVDAHFDTLERHVLCSLSASIWRTLHMRQPRGNLGTGERVTSAVMGVALSLFASRAGGPLLKIAAGTAAFGLLGRAFAGHCAMKAALKHESSLRQGMSDQWRRMREPFRGAARRVADRLASPADAGDRTDEASRMSHQNERVTGSRVPPGAGDSEAGLTGVNS